MNISIYLSTPPVASHGAVSKRLLICRPELIQKRVGVTQRGQVGFLPVGIDQAEQASDCGSRGRSPTDGANMAVDVDVVVVCETCVYVYLCCHDSNTDQSRNNTIMWFCA